jgi:site-specific DNA-adenine methylase
MHKRLRAPVRWYGGKGQMIAKLMRHVPLGGRPYCEPYMGAASLFFARQPAPVEVLNDLDGDLVNLFRCLQDKSTFDERLSMLDDWHLRLLRAQIDNRDALEVIRYWDTPDAVFYLDPPYHLETRVRAHTNVYTVEQNHDHHAELVKVLVACKGAVVLSCYDHPVYSALANAGWMATRYKTACHAAARNRNSGLQGAGTAMAKVPRVEVVWANPRARHMRGELW